MSFHICFLGTVRGLKGKIIHMSDNLTGNSKKEFDAVRPALELILDQHVGGGVVSLNASGHASFDLDGNKTYGQCNVKIEQIGILVTD